MSNFGCTCWHRGQNVDFCVFVQAQSTECRLLCVRAGTEYIMSPLCVRAGTEDRMSTFVCSCRHRVQNVEFSIVRSLDNFVDATLRQCDYK